MGNCISTAHVQDDDHSNSDSTHSASNHSSNGRRGAGGRRTPGGGESHSPLPSSTNHHHHLQSASVSIPESSGLRRKTGKSSLSEALRRSSLLYPHESPLLMPSDVLLPPSLQNESLIVPRSPSNHDVTRTRTNTSRSSVGGGMEDGGGASSSSTRDIKILLLGTGESGKSTILKQMRILHKGGFSVDERLAYRPDIYRNVVESMQQILLALQGIGTDFDVDATTTTTTTATATTTTTTCPLAEIKAKTAMYAQYILALDAQTLAEQWDEDADTCGLPGMVVEALDFLWAESGVQRLYPRLLHVSYVIDSAPYFLDELGRIKQPAYIPTDADIVRARTTTTGITEVTFKSRFFNIRMIDVGGQRSERDRKWVQCFEGVTCVIFCVSLSEYDQVLLEESNTNRMLESFQLFEDVVNSQWFLNSSIVLFLNKTDLFCRKLDSVPLERYFEDFATEYDHDGIVGSAHNKSTTPTTSSSSMMQRFERAAEFLRDKFLSLNQFRLQIYPYLTCATDTDNVAMVFQAVEETVLANALRDTGIF